MVNDCAGDSVMEIDSYQWQTTEVNLALDPKEGGIV